MGFVTAALATVAVGSAAASISASQKSAKAINNQTRVQQQIAENENMRSRINSIRASRMARASAAQAAVNQGASSSSIAQGVQASLTSQANADISFLDRQGALGRQSAAFATQANKYSSRAQAYGAVSSLAMQAAGSNFAARADAQFAKIFKKPTLGSSGITNLDYGFRRVTPATLPGLSPLTPDTTSMSSFIPRQL